MATLLDLRRRVRSVRNIRQITRAMKMVAAAKLRRTQDRIIAARPYSDKLWEVLNDLAERTEERDHPLLRSARQEHVTAVIVTSDRGLCGSFNTNVVRRATTALHSWQDQAVNLVPVGKAGYTYFRRRDWPIGNSYLDCLSDLSFAGAAAIGHYLIEEFTEERTDAVYVIYNEFKSVLRQQVVVEPLLPILGIRLPQRLGVTAREAARAFAEQQAGGSLAVGFGEIGSLAGAWARGRDEAEAALVAEMAPVELVDYLYEPSAAAIFGELLPRHVEVQVFRALMESVAAEHARA